MIDQRYLDIYREYPMLTFMDFILLILVYEEQYALLGIAHDDNFMEFNNSIRRLERMGFIKWHGEQPTDVTLRRTAEDTFKKHVGLKKKITTTREVTQWVETWRELFPKGVNSGGYRYRGDKAEVVKKMIKFVNTHDYTIEQIFQATTDYVERFSLKGYAYMQLAHYFIEKKGVGSTLSAECEGLAEKSSNKEEGEIMVDQSNKILPMLSLEDAARKELRYIKGRMENRIKSLKTPWKKFDKAGMNGIEWGSIITIAGMSGSGKTAILNELESGLFALNPDEKFAVLSFNFEMMARRLVGRKISKKLKMTTTQIYNADTEDPTKNIKADTYQRAVTYAESIKDMPLWYVDIPGTVQEIKNTIEYFAMGMECNVDRGILVTLDHSILVKKFGEQNQNQVLYELAAMFNELKKKIKASFVIVSQLNRGIEAVERIQNKNLHYPQKSDVFGADALYQYSDIFMITHRPEMLNLRAYGPTDLPVSGIIYFHFIKTRETEPFIAKMRNNLKYNQVLDYD